MDPNNITNIDEARTKAKHVLLLGALSFFLAGAITGVPAVIMGHRELSKHKKKSKIYSSSHRRIIIGGMILGYLGIMLTIYLIILLASM